MSRLPFPDNPSSDEGGPGDEGSPATSSRGRKAPPMSVSQASELIRAALAEALPPRIRVVGEISNFSDRTHWFFSLKDEGATLRCVCFASAARRVGFRVQNGIEVVASGRVDYYAQQGSIQLYVDRMEPVGMGALELQLKQLIEELRQEGYFDPMRKMPLPLMPGKVAVVTSRSGAALQDVINTAHRRWPGCRLYLYDVHVQGAAAAPEVAHAIDQLSRHGRKLGIEAIILTRGGGSIEDLWAFNERVVADALYRCPLPVVAAIGHETDTTVAELVADVRCATPTQAAMHLIPDRGALVQQVNQQASRLGLQMRRQWAEAARWADLLEPRLLSQVRQRLSSARQQVDAAARHPVLRRPRTLLQQQEERLARLRDSLLAASKQRAVAGRQRVESLGRHLTAVGPQSVLERGYTYTLTASGELLRSSTAAKAGDRLITVLADGRVASVVTETGERGDAAVKPAKSAPSDGAEAGKPKPAKRKRSRKRTSPSEDQPGLFG